MMNPNYSAKIIPALSCSLLVGLFAAGLTMGQSGASRKGSKPGVAKAPKAAKSTPKKAPGKAAAAPRPSAAKGGELARLVRAYRGNPSAGRLAAIENYAASHRAGESGNAARLALGVIRYEKGDYAQAIAALEPVKLAAISDYAAYYLAAARVEAQKFETVARDLAPVYRTPFASPLAGRARLLEARALQPSNPEAAIKLLRENYGQLPQPEGDLILADSYKAAKSLPAAAEYYQRVYYGYLSGAAATRAAAALVTLKDTMGLDYPPPLPQQMLQRADKLLEIRDYSKARAEYDSVIAQTGGLQRDTARVRAGAASYLAGETSSAFRYLRGLSLSESEADAERLYYIVECARRLDNDDEMKAALKRLDERYAKSSWRLKALIAGGNRYLLLNKPSEYVPFYSAAARDFKGESAAATAQWKVAFQAWMSEAGPVTDMPRSREPENLLREHVQTYPGGPTAAAAMYFLGRAAEQEGDRGAARAYYRKISDALPNTYYAIQARQRLARPEITAASPSARVSQFLDGLSLRAPRPIPLQPTAATNARIDRSRLLRSAGLNDLADSELRFGFRTDGQPALLALEMGRSADEPYQALRAMKSMAGDYLSLALEDAPREFWELLFPLPFRNDLFAAATSRDLDPYFLAGLIRQESEFNPAAVSRANAYGLTQVRPATGRLYAQRAGVGRFRNALLLQPGSNLKIGSTILRSMLDTQGGKLEPALAAYNAGPNRAVEWLAWNAYREPAEFVESIPFTETRDYVQAVLRNADIYRRLYAK